MQDIGRLQGTWNIVALEMEGAEYSGRMRLDPASTPKHLDLALETGPHAGETHLVIYTFEGPRWKLCLNVTATMRPAEFAAPKGSGVALEWLERATA